MEGEGGGVTGGAAIGSGDGHRIRACVPHCDAGCGRGIAPLIGGEAGIGSKGGAAAGASRLVGADLHLRAREMADHGGIEGGAAIGRGERHGICAGSGDGDLWCAGSCAPEIGAEARRSLKLQGRAGADLCVGQGGWCGEAGQDDDLAGGFKVTTVGGGQAHRNRVATCEGEIQGVASQTGLPWDGPLQMRAGGGGGGQGDIGTGDARREARLHRVVAGLGTVNLRVEKWAWRPCRRKWQRRSDQRDHAER